MFMLEAKKSIVVGVVATAVLFTGCMTTGGSSYAITGKNIDGASVYERTNGKYTAYAISTQSQKGFNSHGRTPTANEIKAWDTDVMSDNSGLPKGSGSVEDGDELYHEQCASCHGDFGVGGKGYPPLEGGVGTLKNQLGLEGTEGPRRTIGSYWPYASTLYWYIKTAMPFPKPKSLTDDEVFAITAYLLAVNGIKVDGQEMEDEFILSDKNFGKIQMNNPDGFYAVHPDRKDLKEERIPLAQGERCMSNCAQPTAKSIQFEIADGFDPKISTDKSLSDEKVETKVSPEAATYEMYCSACHSNKAIGAPVIGDKEAWAETLDKGVDAVYTNGINGISAMPPKGGADISDEEFKKVVDYIINSSK